MSLVVYVPLFTDNTYSYTTTLNSNKYILRFYINSRTNGLYMDIQDSTAKYLYTGLRILPLEKIAANTDSPLGGYFYLLPYAPNTVFEDITPQMLGQYYRFMFITN